MSFPILFDKIFFYFCFIFIILELLKSFMRFLTLIHFSRNIWAFHTALRTTDKNLTACNTIVARWHWSHTVDDWKVLLLSDPITDGGRMQSQRLLLIWVVGVAIVLSAGLPGGDRHHIWEKWVLQALLLLLDLINNRISAHCHRSNIAWYMSPYLVFSAYRAP